MNRKIIIGCTLILLLTNCTLTFCQNSKGLSKEEITRKAIAEYKKVTSDNFLKNRTIIYDDENKKWQEKLKYMISINTKNYEFLKAKNYQAVCFAFTPPPNEKWFGGDAWFFIDRITGVAITNYIEK